MAEAVTIRVMCRFRPLNSAEQERGDAFLPSFPAEDQVKLDGKTYSFDRVFNEKTTQEMVYKSAALPIVKDSVSKVFNFCFNSVSLFLNFLFTL